ncbi:MAG: hypothetical protein ABL875_03665 [Candidatus Nitrotoga sp.]
MRQAYGAGRQLEGRPEGQAVVATLVAVVRAGLDLAAVDTLAAVVWEGLDLAVADRWAATGAAAATGIGVEVWASTWVRRLVSDTDRTHTRTMEAHTMEPHTMEHPIITRLLPFITQWHSPRP